MRGGVRLGFETAIGRGIGGTVEYKCDPAFSTACTGQTVKQDRDPGVMLMLGFQIGFGVGYPEPELPK